MSVEAVSRSEELNTSFDKTIKEIQVMEENLRQREEHLAVLVVQLPRQVSKLSARFDRAMLLVDDPDVEDDAAVEIKSLADDVANLSTSMSTDEGQKPDYLAIEKRHLSLDQELAEAHDTAAKQKQEMNDLRTNIPQLVDGYNNLATALRDFAKQPKVRLNDTTRNKIAKLQAYKFELAPDRQNLRQQQRKLEKLAKNAYMLIERAEKEAGEDSPLLVTAKIVGGAALAAVGINLFG